MFESFGAQLDDWLHGWNLRRLRLARRLGMLPKPTPAELEAAEAWARTSALIDRLEARLVDHLEDVAHV